MKTKTKVKKEKKEKKKLPVRFILIYEHYESSFSLGMFNNGPQVLTFSTLTELQKWLKKQTHIRSVVVYEVAERIEVEQIYQFKIGNKFENKELWK